MQTTLGLQRVEQTVVLELDVDQMPRLGGKGKEGGAYYSNVKSSGLAVT